MNEKICPVCGAIIPNDEDECISRYCKDLSAMECEQNELNESWEY